MQNKENFILRWRNLKNRKDIGTLYIVYGELAGIVILLYMYMYTSVGHININKNNYIISIMFIIIFYKLGYVFFRLSDKEISEIRMWLAFKKFISYYRLLFSNVVKKFKLIMIIKNAKNNTEEDVEVVKVEKYYFYNSQLCLGKEKKILDVVLKAPSITQKVIYDYLPVNVQNNLSFLLKIKTNHAGLKLNLKFLQEQGKTKQIKEYDAYSTGTTKSKILSNGIELDSTKISKDLEPNQFLTLGELTVISRGLSNKMKKGIKWKKF